MKSFKGLFPFKLATTSYIYPDHILPNVAMLAPFFDEIELVLFESTGLDNDPDQAEMKGLMDLSLSRGVRYHVHLPIDVYLGDRDEEVRRQGVSTVRNVMERTLCLNPSLYTLHFEIRNSHGRKETDIDAWRKRLTRSVQEIVKWEIEPNHVAIETLEYPFEWIEDIINEFGFSICFDIGHLLIREQNLQAYFKRYGDNISIIHLHGFEGGNDHLGIDRLNREILGFVISWLRGFTGILSIEVFSYDHLTRSLEILEKEWNQ
jgi:sugar phosphate isomerase/epimerase